jgi:hypothetical protein
VPSWGATILGASWFKPLLFYFRQSFEKIELFLIGEGHKFSLPLAELRLVLALILVVVVVVVVVLLLLIIIIIKTAKI